MTRSMERILRLLHSRGLERECAVELSGADIMALIAINSGTAYPALMRLETDHLLTSRWAEPNAKGSPRRRVYRITDAGLDVLKLKEEEITK
jgi:DNA-binding PadR family transcriptional regulator